MGALHEGHLSLVRAAVEECGFVVVSVFVNPTQFGPKEDYARYPRDLASDAEMLESAGADVLFAPSVEEMYPGEGSTAVDVGSLATVFEGAVRPRHFGGVATIVSKLLNIAPADRAYFGRKDYQQTVVVRRLVRDLNFPTEIVVCPIVRESDGLAMSSRNEYLSAEQRREATALYEGLRLAKGLFDGGERSSVAVRSAVRDHFTRYPAAELEYVDCLADGGLAPIEALEPSTVVVLAARFGRTRLLDNTVLGESVGT